jgi:hypothetical protein
MNDEQRSLGLTITCRRSLSLSRITSRANSTPQMTAEVEAHLERCDGCHTYVEQMRATISPLGTVRVATLSETAQTELLRAFRDLRG